jgi:hypothetical protein
MRPAALFSLAFLALTPYLAFSDSTENILSTVSNEPATTQAAPTPKANSDNTPKTGGGQSSTKALEIHKPMLSPAWGKVIQYRKEVLNPNSDKNRETLYEFVLQDDQGIIRTATYHESASGDGYWEVLVWDQP